VYRTVSGPIAALKPKYAALKGLFPVYGSDYLKYGYLRRWICEIQPPPLPFDVEYIIIDDKQIFLSFLIVTHILRYVKGKIKFSYAKCI